MGICEKCVGICEKCKPICRVVGTSSCSSSGASCNDMLNIVSLYGVTYDMFKHISPSTLDNLMHLPAASDSADVGRWVVAHNVVCPNRNECPL